MSCRSLQSLSIYSVSQGKSLRWRLGCPVCSRFHREVAGREHATTFFTGVFILIARLIDYYMYILTI